MPNGQMLLQGKLSKPVMERVCRQADGLFRKPADIKFSCSCPDGASMCKHVAAARRSGVKHLSLWLSFHNSGQPDQFHACPALAEQIRMRLLRRCPALETGAGQSVTAIWNVLKKITYGRDDPGRIFTEAVPSSRSS